MNSGSPKTTATCPHNVSDPLFSRLEQARITSTQQGGVPQDCRVFVDGPALELGVLLAERNAWHHASPLLDRIEPGHQLDIPDTHGDPERIERRQSIDRRCQSAATAWKRDDRAFHCPTLNSGFHLFVMGQCDRGSIPQSPREFCFPYENLNAVGAFEHHAFITEPKGIRFGMREGQRTVLCILTREALIEVFGSSDQAHWEDIFKANRAIVEAIASDMYDAGETVRVTSRELEPQRLIVSAVTALNRSTSDAGFLRHADGAHAPPLPQGVRRIL